jgi:hypothetical protein
VYPKKVGGVNLYNLAKRAGVIMRTIAKYSGMSNINSGLVVWWKFDESSGTTAADSSGNGKSGTLTNMTAPGCWTVGKLNNALTFDGTNDHVVNSSIGSLGACSVSMWVKKNGAPAGNQRAFDLAQASAWGINAFATGTSGNASLDNNGGCVEELDSTVNVCDNAWHHIVVTRTGSAPSTFKMYVDGVLKVTSSHASNTAPTLTRLFVASTSDNNGNFAGQIDDVRVYDRALSADDVTALYNVTAP